MRQFTALYLEIRWRFLRELDLERNAEISPALDLFSLCPNWVQLTLSLGKGLRNPSLLCINDHRFKTMGVYVTGRPRLFGPDPHVQGKKASAMSPSWAVDSQSPQIDSPPHPSTTPSRHPCPLPLKSRSTNLPSSCPAQRERVMTVTAEGT